MTELKPLVEIKTSVLVDMWNAILANAYPGDELAIEDELSRRGELDKLSF